MLKFFLTTGQFGTTLFLKDSDKTMHAQHMYDFIDKNDIPNEKQFGFRAKHSTYMPILELTDKITSAVEKKE